MGSAPTSDSVDLFSFGPPEGGRGCSHFGLAVDEFGSTGVGSQEESPLSRRANTGAESRRKDTSVDLDMDHASCWTETTLAVWHTVRFLSS